VCSPRAHEVPPWPELSITLWSRLGGQGQGQGFVDKWSAEVGFHRVPGVGRRDL
jgi:hypothetical protein